MALSQFIPFFYSEHAGIRDTLHPEAGLAVTVIFSTQGSLSSGTMRSYSCKILNIVYVASATAKCSILKLGVNDT